MITSREAISLVKEHARKNLAYNSEIIQLQEAQNRILLEDINATYDQPPFDRVSMDGIAISFEALKNNNDFTIENIQQAGHEQIKLQNTNNCIEVMTGAPMPYGCDTVIPYEVLEISNKIAKILSPSEIIKGQNIHDQGSDYKKNSLLITKSTRLTSRHISIIASCGIKNIKVKAHPVIAIVSTGDELIDPGNHLLPHQIFKSNSYALTAILKDHHTLVNNVTHLPDDRNKMLLELQKTLDQNQIIILTGSVSKGKFDFLPSVLADLGVKIIFHKVKQKPGKPLLFGIGSNNQVIFGLPGNPVSCMVNLRKYIIEALKDNFKHTMHVQITEDIHLKKDMTFFINAKLIFSNKGTIGAAPIQGNGSGDFYSLRDSDGFIEIDNMDNKNIFSAGSILPFYHWNY